MHNRISCFLPNLCAALALLLLAAWPRSADAFTIDALWDFGGLQICNLAGSIQFQVHARPIYLSYSCLAPPASARICYFQKAPELFPDLRLLNIKCTITPAPPPDPSRIHLSSFEHREQAGF